MSKVIDLARYCPDCGDPLSNPKRCRCGWKVNQKSEAGKPYSENCMVSSCRNETDVVIRNGGEYITRCCSCYDKDLRRVGKNQLRIPA